MKRVSKVLLVFISIILGVLCTNIFIVKEYQRLRNFEKTDDSLEIYVREANFKTDDFLEELQYLSDEYGVSFATSHDKGHDYIKSFMIQEETFPYEEFGGYFDPSDESALPVFMNVGTLKLVDMLSFYKESGDSINRTYQIISNKDYDREGLLNDLADFLATDRKDLTEKKFGSGFSYINKTSIYSVLAIGLGIIALFFVSIYTPLMEIRKIGINKLMGIGTFDILKKYMVPNILIIFIASLLVDGFLFAINTYRPQGFMSFLVMMQALLLLIYLLTGLIVFFIVNKITINKLLKGFISLKWLHFINFAFKIAFSVFSILSLYSTSFVLDFRSDLVNQAYIYNKYAPDLLSSEFVKEDDDRLFMKTEEYVKIPYDAYKNLIKRIDDVYFIYYDNYRPSVYDDDYDKEVSFEVLNVNANYLKELGLEAKPGENVLYLPKSLEGENLEDVFKYYFDDSKSTKDIDKNKLKQISIDIYYYDKDIKTLSYNDNKPLIENPIISLVDDYNMTKKQMRSLGNSSLKNPIKIKNTEENRQIIEDVYSKYEGTYYLKFSPIQSIFNEQLSTITETIIMAASTFVGLTILSIFVSYFTIQAYFLTEERYLNVSKLLGHGIIRRFKALFTLIGLIDGLSLVSLAVMTKNIYVVGLYALFILVDIILIFTFIKIKDKKSLVRELKED